MPSEWRQACQSFARLVLPSAELRALQACHFPIIISSLLIPLEKVQRCCPPLEVPEELGILAARPLPFLSLLQQNKKAPSSERGVPLPRAPLTHGSLPSPQCLLFVPQPRPGPSCEPRPSALRARVRLPRLSCIFYWGDWSFVQEEEQIQQAPP